MFESLVVLLSTGLISSAPEEASSLSWMDSTVETDKHATLKLASRRYARDLEDESGIWLVGVTHIGDGSFYNAVEELVQDSDLVLYESVMPRVTMTIPAGVSNEKRREVTQEAVDWLAQAIGSVSSMDTPPIESIEQLQVAIQLHDRRLVDAVRNLRTDAWGNPMVLNRNGNLTSVTSHGADGFAGGEGDAGDIVATVDLGVPVFAAEGIQESLATGLKLEFQLAVLPYERDDWVVCDMSWEDLKARFAETNVDLEGLSGMLEGSSLPAGIAKLFLRLLPAMDLMTGGGVTDGIKVLLVELLGREESVNVAIRELGEGTGRILIDERNQVVIDQLQDHLTEGYELVSVVYGAGHMQDLGQRLEQLGYVPVETRWLPAISVDLENSSLSRSHLRMLRQSVNMAMMQMNQRASQQR